MFSTEQLREKSGFGGASPDGRFSEPHAGEEGPLGQPLHSHSLRSFNFVAPQKKTMVPFASRQPLPTETNVESGTSQSKRGTSVHLSNRGESHAGPGWWEHRDLLFFFSTLVTGPKRSLRLKLSDTRVYEPEVRARLGTTAHVCTVVATQ